MLQVRTLVLPLKRSLIGGLCFVSVLAASGAFSQTRFVFGTVTSDFSKAIPNTEINIDTGQTDRTTDTGRFRFQLPPLKVGFPYTFHVLSWVIIDPCILARGRMYLPAPEAEPISIRVLRPRDKRLLSANSLGCLIEEKFSRFSGHSGGGYRSGNNLFFPLERASPFAFQRRRSRSPFSAFGIIAYGTLAENDTTTDESFWQREATSLGFTIEEVRTAMDNWASSVTDPYQAGLAAMYRHQYSLASKYISSSLGPELDTDTESDTDVKPAPHAERFVLLARAEFEQKNYSRAESALRTFLDTHPEDELGQKNLDIVRAAIREEKEELEKSDLSGDWIGFTEYEGEKHPLRIRVEKEENAKVRWNRKEFSADINGLKCRGEARRFSEIRVTLTCGTGGYKFEGVMKVSRLDRVITGEASGGDQAKMRFYVKWEH